MFGSLSSTIMSLMIGSYASSAVTFPGVKVRGHTFGSVRDHVSSDAFVKCFIEVIMLTKISLSLSLIQLIFNAGVSFPVIMWVWSGVAGMAFLNCFVNWPVESFLTPEELQKK